MSVAGVALLLGLATVDARVQAAVDRAVVDAALVLDVASGQVLAERGRTRLPLPPGSTFKLVTTLAAFRVAPEAIAGAQSCAGRARIGRQDLTCWRAEGHGRIALEQALAASCNLYFAALGEQVGARALLDEARALGLGAAGSLPPATAPAAGLGDGVGVLLTAHELAGLARQIARGQRGDGVVVARPEQLERLRRGLREAVVTGTARAAAASVPVAGKTGSGVHGAREVGWFVGLAPASEPTMIIVLMRRGRRGAEVAAAAPPIVDAFFRGRGAGAMTDRGGEAERRAAPRRGVAGGR